MVWNIGRLNCLDVTLRHLPVPGLVGLLAEFIPFTGKNTSAAQLFERDSESSDAGEQIDKCEIMRRWLNSFI